MIEKNKMSLLVPMYVIIALSDSAAVLQTLHQLVCTALDMFSSEYLKHKILNLILLIGPKSQIATTK